MTAIKKADTTNSVDNKEKRKILTLFNFREPNSMAKDSEIYIRHEDKIFKRKDSEKI